MRKCSVAQSLKEVAGEKNIPIIASTKVGRNVDGRKDKHPALRDLREKRFFDGIIFVYRKGHYDIDAGDDMELILAKNDSGPTGAVHVRYDGKRGCIKF